MSDVEREAFEREFPVPKDVEWCGNGYTPTKYSADQGYNRMWKVWQAARQAPASGEVEPVAEVITSEFERLDSCNPDYVKDIDWLDHVDVDQFPDGTKLYTHPPAKVPEGLVEAIKAITDKMEKVEGESADGGYMWDARECAEFIRKEADLLTTPTPATTPGAEIPEGWKLVPVHATANMVRRGKRAHGEEFLFNQDPETNIQSIWKAMVAIAPAPPQEQ